jgi:hypothetical protein
MAAVTAALLGLSALTKAAAARKAGNYQADQLNTNAALEDQQAADALARGKDAVSRQQTGLRGFEGSQRVALAAQGIDTGSGTAADLQSDTATLGEMDRLMIEHNAAREAYGFSSGAAIARSQAGQARAAGNSAARTTLLTAASQLYAMRPTKKAS